MVRAHTDWRLLFVTDLHGAERCFELLLEQLATRRFDVVVVGGDVTGKLLVPIVPTAHGQSAAHFKGATVQLTSPSETNTFVTRAAATGAYAYPCTSGEYLRLLNDMPYREAIIQRLIDDRLARWLGQLQRVARATHIKVIFNLGNDDSLSCNALFPLNNVELAEGTVIELLNGISIASCGYANDTPWHLPRDEPEDKLHQRLQTLIATVEDKARLICNFHAPPYASGLDTAILLEPDLRPQSGGFGPLRGPVGSHAVDRVIREMQPLLGLHGHIHESAGRARLGRTVCLNPGSEYEAGILRVAECDFEGSSLTRASLKSLL